MGKSSQSFIVRAAIGVAMTSGAAAALAQAAAGQVFTCTNAKGQHLRSDRPIAECMDREQRVLARDGSLLRVVAPNLTLQEMADKAARDKRIAAEQEARREAERADQLLMQRYADEAVHDKARQAALDPLRASLAQSELRVRTLAGERKPLLEEAEFYKNKPLPTKLKHQFDANDAATEAQRVLVANQQAEIARVNALYDAELARLKRLWAGAAPGSLGPVATPKADAAKGSDATKTADARVAESQAATLRK